MPNYMTNVASYYITTEDLTEFLPDVATTKLQAMIDDVFAAIVALAPAVDQVCGDNPPLTNAQSGLVTSIARQAVVSYEKSDGGNVSTEQEMAGPFSKMTVVDSRSYKRGLLNGFQVEQLKALQVTLSGATNKSRAIEVDLLPSNWSYSSNNLGW